MNKPCPFCGGECRSDDAGKWWIECGRGCFTGPMYPTESEAWTAHNAGPVHALAERDGEWTTKLRGLLADLNARACEAEGAELRCAFGESNHGSRELRYAADRIEELLT